MRSILLGMALAALLVPRLAVAADLGPLAGTPFNKHEITDNLGRTITYYISHPAKPAPLMLMIQGSGCAPVFIPAGAGVASTVFGAGPNATEGRFTVLVVDKPFSSERAGAQPGTATACDPRFNVDFTAERWLEALRAALTDARKLPWVDRSRTLVFGHSEGAVMAALVAGSEPSVTDVIWLAGSGTTQLFDQFAQTYDTCVDRAACFAELEAEVKAINAKPDSATDFAWGHPFKRWSSFYRVSPVDELLKSKARVYVGDGTADRSVSVMSLELVAAKLLSAGHDVTIRRVPGADHGLNGPESTTAKEYQRALDWFWIR